MAKATLPIADIEFKQQNRIPLNKREKRNLYGNCGDLKSGIRQMLRIRDLQDYCNRYTWYCTRLPLKSTEINRLFYEKASLIYFYCEPLDEFLLTPWTHVRGLDYWGRPKIVSPIPFVEESNPQYEILKKTLSTIELEVVYEPLLEEDFYNEDGSFDKERAQHVITHSCVMFNDRTESFGGKPVPRKSSVEPLLDVEANIIPYIDTALQNSTSVAGLRVGSDDEAQEVLELNDQIQDAALHHQKFIPLIGQLEFQELNGSTAGATDDFFKAMESLEAFRTGSLGIDNTGFYQKAAYTNTIDSATSNVGTALVDGLSNLQDACCIVNSIWDNAIWVEVSECISNIDRNLDGMPYDTKTYDQTTAMDEGDAPDENTLL